MSIPSEASYAIAIGEGCFPSLFARKQGLFYGFPRSIDIVPNSRD